MHAIDELFCTTQLNDRHLSKPVYQDLKMKKSASVSDIFAKKVNFMNIQKQNKKVAL